MHKVLYICYTRGCAQAPLLSAVTYPGVLVLPCPVWVISPERMLLSCLPCQSLVATLLLDAHGLLCKPQRLSELFLLLLPVICLWSCATGVPVRSFCSSFCSCLCSCYVYRMQVQPWHQVLMLLASARIKLLGCPACSLFRWLAPVSSDCSCCIASPRGVVITR